MFRPRRGTEESTLVLRRARACWIDASWSCSRRSLLAEMRIGATSAAELVTEGWRRIAGTPRALRRRLRRARHLEALRDQGVDVGPDGRRLLRQRSHIQASLAHAARPAMGVSEHRPPRAAVYPRDFEGDLFEFRKRMLHELGSILDFHIKPPEHSVIGRPKFSKADAALGELTPHVNRLDRMGARLGQRCEQMSESLADAMARMNGAVGLVHREVGPLAKAGRKFAAGQEDVIDRCEAVLARIEDSLGKQGAVSVTEARHPACETSSRATPVYNTRKEAIKPRSRFWWMETGELVLYIQGSGGTVPRHATSKAEYRDRLVCLAEEIERERSMPSSAGSPPRVPVTPSASMGQ